MALTLKKLAEQVSLLCLDAGNTVIFLDHAQVAQVLDAQGFHCEIPALIDAEGYAKRVLGTDREAPAIEGFSIHRGWSVMVRTMIERAGVSPAQSPDCVRALWTEHDRLNLWRRVPDGLKESLLALRACGVQTCIVSNSEGKLRGLFAQLEILDCFDHIVDSALVGVEKPDPKIFAHALALAGCDAAHAIHLGDTVATDVDGAANAGLRTALIDPWGHYANLYPELLRVADVSTVVSAIIQQKHSQK
jgi:HAD superfamily hydrolase (TIGR01509 family)